MADRTVGKLVVFIDACTTNVPGVDIKYYPYCICTFDEFRNKYVTICVYVIPPGRGVKTSDACVCIWE